MNEVFVFLTLILVSFCAGSLPTAYLIVKVLLKQDIRTLGSKNSGATNVLRTAGFMPALLVLCIDFLKGFLLVFIVLHGTDISFFPAQHLALLVGGIAVLGHVFSPWLKFKGGKGVATGAGVFTALYPPLFPICLGIFAITLFFTRTMSIASIVTALSIPLVSFALHVWFHTKIDPAYLAVSILIPVVVIFAHRKNILRLLAGTEPKISW